jgi:hypothetical protein
MPWAGVDRAIRLLIVAGIGACCFGCATTERKTPTYPKKRGPVYIRFANFTDGPVVFKLNKLPVQQRTETGRATHFLREASKAHELVVSGDGVELVERLDPAIGDAITYVLVTLAGKPALKSVSAEDRRSGMSSGSLLRVVNASDAPIGSVTVAVGSSRAAFEGLSAWAGGNARGVSSGRGEVRVGSRSAGTIELQNGISYSLYVYGSPDKPQITLLRNTPLDLIPTETVTEGMG